MKLDVDSPDLRRLNKKIAAREHTDTHGTYEPHITLAYVKPGLGEKYAGKATALTGQELTLNSIVFSGKDRKKTEI